MMCQGRTLLLLVLAMLVTLVVPFPSKLDAADSDDPWALPDDFLFGAGVAAVQSEGAWNVDGKAPSVVDAVFNSDKLEAFGFKPAHTHDVAADSYHRYKEDVAMAAKLKLQLYRFSISWSRVLPDSNAANPNPLGVQYYHNLIDEIRSHGMIPLVTLWHFDHPQALEEQFSGWQDRKMVEKYTEYVKFIFAEYGSKVQLWASSNEPNVYCSYIPNLMVKVGLMDADKVNAYACMHHFLLAHGYARKALTESGHKGTIGMTVTTLNSRPNSTRPEDVYASEVFNEFYLGMLLRPVVYGDYPQVVKDLAANHLFVFTEEEKELLKDSTDFIGLNVYYGMLVSYRDPLVPKTPVDMPLQQLLEQANFLEVGYRDDNGHTVPNFVTELITPDAMRSAVLSTWFTYKKPILITENGVGSTAMPGTDDYLREVYYSAYLRALVSTVRDFGVKVMGYCAWSLVDSFEWSVGYDRPYGLVHIDYKGGSLDRTLKKSASFWIEMATSRSVPVREMQPSPSSSPSPSPSPSAASSSLPQLFLLASAVALVASLR